MTTPDITTLDTTIEENVAETATAVQDTTPAALSEATSGSGSAVEATAKTATVAAEAPAPAVGTETVVAVPAATESAVAETVAVEEEPQTAVFSLVTFFLAALPVVGVILNSISVARAGKEGFDLWLARWGLALAIIETVGALALVGLGYYLGVLTAGTA